MIATLARPVAGLSVWLQHLPATTADRDEIRQLAESGRFTDLSITGPGSTGPDAVDHARWACDLLRAGHRRSGGREGLVAVPVTALTSSTEGYVNAARALARAVDRPNLLAALPASDNGIAAIAPLLAEGIGVRTGPVFSAERYRRVARAQLRGLALAHRQGRDLAALASAATFGVGGIDVEIDALLDRAGSHESKALRGLAGIAGARSAQRILAETFDPGIDPGIDPATAPATAPANDPANDPGWRTLAAAGAQPPRLVWSQLYLGVPGHRSAHYLARLSAPGESVELCPAALAEAGPLRAGLRRLPEEHESDERIIGYLRWFGIHQEDVLQGLETT